MKDDGRGRWLVLLLVCVAQLMIVLDGTIVNVALPAIEDDLSFSRASLSWVVNAYLLTFGGFLLLGGRAGDILGRRRVVMGGLALFTLASLFCGLADSQSVLVAARTLQGIGEALIAPAALSIIVTTFTESSERARAMGIWGFVASGGGTIGVLLGGVLVGTLRWPWIFFVNPPWAHSPLLCAGHSSTPVGAPAPTRARGRPRWRVPDHDLHPGRRLRHRRHRDRRLDLLKDHLALGRLCDALGRFRRRRVARGLPLSPSPPSARAT